MKNLPHFTKSFPPQQYKYSEVKSLKKHSSLLDDCVGNLKTISLISILCVWVHMKNEFIKLIVIVTVTHSISKLLRFFAQINFLLLSFVSYISILVCRLNTLFKSDSKFLIIWHSVKLFVKCENK